MDEQRVVLNPRRNQKEEEKKIIKPKKNRKRKATNKPLKPSLLMNDKSKKGPIKASETEFKKRKRISTYEELFDAIEDIDIAVFRKGIERVFDRNKKIRPGFSSSWVSPHPKVGAKAITSYEIDGSSVTLFQLPDEVESSYHVNPIEYELPLDQVKLIHEARRHLSDQYPKNIQIDNPQQAKEYISKSGNRLLYQLAKKYKVELGKNRLEEMQNVKKLSEVLAKYTAGLGVVEFFLKDSYVQDIYIDASPWDNKVYIKLGGINEPLLSEKCVTNVSVGEDDAESLLSRFRYESGRPFSEAMPVLETDLSAYKARATAIGKPLSPDGIAIALRRHSTDPWTLLKLIHNGTITSLGAGLLSFLIDGNSTMLVVGSRGAGKTSLLGALMFEFPHNQRILTIEDTLELPVLSMQEIGYKVQSMYVQSSLGGKAEMSADEALRISLRLGESAIVMGEVRGQEARTLYEAMRAGTAGSSVLGTFHADSAKSVYQRVVHDMHIPPKSFLATDIIIVCGLVRPGGSQRQKRSLLQIAEVRKNENEDNMFSDLMSYDVNEDRLKETDSFNYRSERIGTIAASWNMSLEECIENIQIRAKYRQMMVDYSRDHNKPQLLSAEWVSKSNSTFWNLIERHRIKAKIENKKLMEDWTKWFERSAQYA
ncbi:MAG: type II/IV secretion system ATPase subunit [Thermoplasmata archaeon]|nr:MAG: type II/IV secretion system ATPase subunit [Thermoplasmata archaeon]